MSTFDANSFQQVEDDESIDQDRIPHAFQVMRNTTVEKFAVNFLNELFKSSQEKGISDVHFESKERGAICRVRSDGLLQVYSLLTDSQYSMIREKIYQRARIEESHAKNHRVDSRAWLRFKNRLDLRVSVLPTTEGFTIVIRLLDQSNSGRKLEELELTTAIRQVLNNVIGSAHGMIILSGPTGSGKTTTLYAALNQINDTTKKIITIENPVEYYIDGVQHINVTPTLTMADALKGALRQDPDIILVGEIRDYETAKIAIQAAQTGHLVLTTLHSNDSVSAITRLIELGIEPTNIAETVLAIAGQRLVRKLENKLNIGEPTDAEKEWLRRNGKHSYLNEHFGRNNAYKGRLPIIEMLLMTDEIRSKILSNQLSEIYELAKKQPQYQTLTDAALEAAKQGKTSLEQAISISKASTQMNLEGLLFGERLLALGYITTTQLEYAQTQVQKTSLISRITLKEFLLQNHFCTIDQILECKDAPDYA